MAMTFREWEGMVMLFSLKIPDFVVDVFQCVWSVWSRTIYIVFVTSTSNRDGKELLLEWEYVFRQGRNGNF